MGGNGESGERGPMGGREGRGGRGPMGGRGGRDGRGPMGGDGMFDMSEDRDRIIMTGSDGSMLFI